MSEAALFLVCEDGDEYTQRFERFLGREFRFQRVSNGRLALEAARRESVSGLLLDLDFRRAAAGELLGETGPPSLPPSPEQRAAWSAAQGILILQFLRSQNLALPALLFADLDDPARVAYLEQTLAPLSIVSGREGLAMLAARLRQMARRWRRP